MLYFTTSTTLLAALIMALKRTIPSAGLLCSLGRHPYRAVRDVCSCCLQTYVWESAIWRPLEITSLHDHALPIRCHDHTLLIGNLDFVFALFLLDFLGEPFFHEAISLASSIDQSDVLTSKQQDRASLTSASYISLQDGLTFIR